MTFLIFCVALLVSQVLWLASPLPGDPLLVIALFSLFFLPYRQALVLVFAAGVLADLTTPLKGISTISYVLIFIGAHAVSQHTSSYRIVPGFFIFNNTLR